MSEPIGETDDTAGMAALCGYRKYRSKEARDVIDISIRTCGQMVVSNSVHAA